MGVQLFGMWVGGLFDIESWNYHVWCDSLTGKDIINKTNNTVQESYTDKGDKNIAPKQNN